MAAYVFSRLNRTTSSKPGPHYSQDPVTVFLRPKHQKMQALKMIASERLKANPEMMAPFAIAVVILKILIWILLL